MTIGLGPQVRMLKLGSYVYWCPGCNAAHQFNTNPSDDPQGRGRSWGWDGDGHRLTLDGEMRITGDGTSCHHYVRGGRINYYADCTHHLAGRTAEVPAFPVRSVEADLLPIDEGTPS